MGCKSKKVKLESTSKTQTLMVGQLQILRYVRKGLILLVSEHLPPYNSMAQFNNCTFGGDPKYIVKFASTTTGRMSFQNCTFENWGQGADVEAISCTKGSISLMGNTFNLDKTHIKLGPNVTNTQILDNSFPTELKIDNSSTGEVVISQEPLELTPQNVPTHPMQMYQDR